MAKIAIDVDDTLYAFGDAVREEFFRMAVERDDKSILKGAYAPFTEWRSLSDSLEGDVVYEAILRVHDKTTKQTPFNGANETIWNLVDSGHEIVYITSRLEKYHEDTLEWLHAWDFPYAVDESLMCVQGSKIPHIRDCKYLIDDRPETVIDFVTDYVWQNWHGSEIQPENERKAFGLWFPYNQALTDVKNVYLAPNWYGIDYYLNRKGLITV